jgi:hypothetical protein
MESSAGAPWSGSCSRWARRLRAVAVLTAWLTEAARGPAAAANEALRRCPLLRGHVELVARLEPRRGRARDPTRCARRNPCSVLAAHAHASASASHAADALASAARAAASASTARAAASGSSACAAASAARRAAAETPALLLYPARDACHGRPAVFAARAVRACRATQRARRTRLGARPALLRGLPATRRLGVVRVCAHGSDGGDDQ